DIVTYKVHRAVAESEERAARVRAGETLRTGVVVQRVRIIERVKGMGQSPMRAVRLGAIHRIPCADPGSRHAEPLALADHKRLARPIGNLFVRNMAVAEEDAIGGATGLIRRPGGSGDGRTSLIDRSAVPHISRGGWQEPRLNLP